MHRLEWADRALSDLGRLQAFLHAKNPRAASTAIDTILGVPNKLRQFPLIGPALSDESPEYRELPIPYSNSGYTILYVVGDGVVEIQAVKHMREETY